MGSLAFTWKDQGRDTDALALMENCAQARRRVLGADHPDTLSSLATVANWGSSLQQQMLEQQLSCLFFVNLL